MQADHAPRWPNLAVAVLIPCFNEERAIPKVVAMHERPPLDIGKTLIILGFCGVRSTKPPGTGQRGAGTGSYEPPQTVVAVELSRILAGARLPTRCGADGSPPRRAHGAVR